MNPDFIAEGIRFTCTDCGACCSGSPGFVSVTDEEIARIAAFLDCTETEFRILHLRALPEGPSLKERDNGDCAFFREGRCSIHPVKPAQCRLYPFWFSNLRSEAAWEKTRTTCPGIGEGRRYEPEEVLAMAEEDLARREKMGLVRTGENRRMRNHEE